jgi:hypothetical protein
MRRVVFFAMAALPGIAAYGQGLLDCLEPDVLRGLVLQGQGERQPVITGAVPSELSALKMPREITWIGSAERIVGRVDATTNLTQVTAAWRSSLAPAAARAAAATALTASGWEVRAQPGASMSVFVSESMQPSQPACRDGIPVNINANAMDGVTYVLATLQRGNNNNSICNQPVRPFTMSNTGLDKYMPRLTIPADPAPAGAGRPQSISTSYSGGGGGVANVSADFTSRDSVTNVARLFAKQMAEQGWISDANWSGAISAGSSWSKQDASDVIQSTLSVAAAEDQRFVATLRVLKLQ